MKTQHTVNKLSCNKCHLCDDVVLMFTGQSTHTHLCSCTICFKSLHCYGTLKYGRNLGNCILVYCIQNSLELFSPIILILKLTLSPFLFKWCSKTLTSRLCCMTFMTALHWHVHREVLVLNHHFPWSDTTMLLCNIRACIGLARFPKLNKFICQNSLQKYTSQQRIHKN